MTGLAQLVADRCAAIAEFKSDIYSHRDQDILTLKDAIEKTPIASPEDLKAALELIRLEATEPHSSYHCEGRRAAVLLKSRLVQMLHRFGDGPPKSNLVAMNQSIQLLCPADRMFSSSHRHDVGDVKNIKRKPFLTGFPQFEKRLNGSLRLAPRCVRSRCLIDSLVANGPQRLAAVLTDHMHCSRGASSMVTACANPRFKPA